jgi:hypothetical protein
MECKAGMAIRLYDRLDQGLEGTRRWGNGHLCGLFLLHLVCVFPSSLGSLSLLADESTPPEMDHRRRKSI